MKIPTLSLKLVILYTYVNASSSLVFQSLTIKWTLSFSSVGSLLLSNTAFKQSYRNESFSMQKSNEATTPNAYSFYVLACIASAHFVHEEKPRFFLLACWAFEIRALSSKCLLGALLMIEAWILYHILVEGRSRSIHSLVGSMQPEQIYQMGIRAAASIFAMQCCRDSFVNR